MEKKILLEICCGSADDVFEAEKGGADRVELNSSLFLGGLTPSVGTLRVVKERARIPVMTMLRPRAGGFCYTDAEYRTMLADEEELIRQGADGVVFGCLHEDGTVDIERTKRLHDAADGRPTVFHRALDVTPDWRKALEELIKIGITRVLTSGQAPAVPYALDVIAQMRKFAGDAIEILPGGGITLSTAKQVIDATGCCQIHLAKHLSRRDASTAGNGEIYFGGALYPPEDRFEVTDSGYVADVVKAVAK